MDDTIVVAGMGLLATVAAAWLSAGFQRRSVREDRLLEAKVRVYGECSSSLYEFARATFNRVRARLEGLPDADRDGLRQEFYRANALARTAIGQVAILTRDDSLRVKLDGVREAIGGLNSVRDRTELTARHDDAQASLVSALESAREELHRPNQARWRSRARR